MRYIFRGTVQGVGFRPTVYRVARDLRLGGFVRNRSDGVEVVVTGEKEGLFIERLLSSLPPLAVVESIVEEPSGADFQEFHILSSSGDEELKAVIPPDITICDACLSDLFDPSNRRYRYPLINCTNCGPRYTIIRDLPYDRERTTMAPFPMCDSCREEYGNPESRFYHAQPIGCTNCGPKLSLGELEGFQAIEEAARRILQGEIIAIKGVGGFHLVARTEEGGRLRRLKRRSKKPFAIMFPSIEKIEEVVDLSPVERELLLSRERPIVIVKKGEEAFGEVAPEIERIGIFLPYNAIYHLLFTLIDRPLIVTSANISGEPIMREEEEVERLGGVEGILTYNRKIERSCDDSVVTTVGSRRLLYRLGRGYGPKSFSLPFDLPPILAVGARQKGSIALSKGDQIILSPHIGDIDTVESFDYFRKVIDDFRRIYRFQEEIVVCDSHPLYEVSNYARSLGVETIEVQHHRAHLWAILAEMELTGHPLAGEEYTAFIWDGTGYGEDGTIWGGEVFVGDERKYHFEPIPIVGGERAIKEIDLIAKSLMRHGGVPVEDPLFNLAYEKGATFLTSSVGRLFDGVAVLAHLATYQDYEGYSGMLIESNYRGEGEGSYPFTIEDGIIKIEWRELLLDERELIPTRFLNTLISIIEAIALKEGKVVLFGGGVFQNRTLLEGAIRRLKGLGLPFHFPTEIPINDGSISLGQLWWALKKGLKERESSNSHG
ncbi:MAG: carbamoyltransferase HypF [Epsilonproteobacteria bacterium]|nr:carbamoyltransferase HypF [Campylobacterota bacterium]NPA56187.1 carbamoyltransferase HypF [Campylobacterota bacterium]